MAKTYREVASVRARFDEGVSAPESAEKWANRASEGSDLFETNFAPVYKDMTTCGSQVAGTGGWDALKNYADCMYKKRGGKGVRGGG